MIIVPPVSSQASPAAQELGQKIATVIREYQQNHPGLPPTDVHQALRIARLNCGVGPNPRLIVALASGLLVLAGFLAFFVFSRPEGNGSGLSITHILVAVFILAMLGIFIVAKR